MPRTGEMIFRLERGFYRVQSKSTPKAYRFNCAREMALVELLRDNNSILTYRTRTRTTDENLLANWLRYCYKLPQRQPSRENEVLASITSRTEEVVEKTIFINYRRSDSQHAAFALAD